MIGQQFGRLTVVGSAPLTVHGMILWQCQCSCGKTLISTAGQLRGGNIKSCGCLAKEKRPDLTGRRFGKLMVIELAGSTAKGARRWHCQCDCGKTTRVTTNLLNRGHTRSCGCFKAEAHITHGLSHTPEHEAWYHMIRRCTKSEDAAYPNYGGRGITVCPRWQESIDNFLVDMGRRPSPHHTLERVNNEGNYEPSNCIWATQRTNQRNRRSAHMITFRGKTQTLIAWAEEYELKPSTLGKRLNNYRWPMEQALMPTNGHNTAENRFLTFNGTTRNITDWARALGMPRNVLYARLNGLQWTEERALTEPYDPDYKQKEGFGRLRSNNKMLTFRGKTQPLIAWAEDLGIDRATLSRRINVYKWSIEEALGTPVGQRRQ